MTSVDRGPGALTLTMVQNWFEELKRLVLWFEELKNLFPTANSSHWFEELTPLGPVP